MTHRKPNLIIAGCQKCGTTWLHSALSKSSQIFASEVKELNFFNKPKFTSSSEAYIANFPETVGVKYYVESTPHYFQKPSGSMDIAANILSFTEDLKIIVVFRNPVERYESAYIHHMMKGRIPYSRWISSITDENKMLTLGKYAEILPHWLERFPDMGVFFYDDLVRNPALFLNDIMEFLDIDNDIAHSDLLFRTNDKVRKASQLGPEWDCMPQLDPALKPQLRKYYKDDIYSLEKMTGRDLSSWLASNQ